MKSFLLCCLVPFVALGIVGCGPKPVAEERPAAEVIVQPERDNPQDATGVEVQVGGGQGVQVEVDKEPGARNP